MTTRRPHVAIVGGGLSGLVAAYQLRQDSPDVELTVVEASDVLGGKLDTGDFPSGPVEFGAEAFVARRPEAAELVAELGLSRELRHPGPNGPAILTGGTLHPMPTGTLMGLPSDATTLTGVLDDAAVVRAGAEAETPMSWTEGQDAPVGELVAERYGPAVVDRLLDPMLGGVYAAPSAGLGLREVVPGLGPALDELVRSGETPTLTAATRVVLSAARPGPVFATFAGGYRTLVTALERAARARVVTGSRVEVLRPEGSGYHLELGGGGDDGGPSSLDADAVVIAVPAPDARRLLEDAAPAAAAGLGEVRTASSAVVAMEIDADFPLPEYSGVLAATDEPVAYKAMTFSSRKWPHLGDRGVHLVRVSFGRLTPEGGVDPVLDRPDDELAALAVEALTDLVGVAPTVRASKVRRWDDGLPEIAPGHPARIAAVRADLAAELPGVELVGAATEGVGVPACVGAARAAARRLRARWQD